MSHRDGAQVLGWQQSVLTRATTGLQYTNNFSFHNRILGICFSMEVVSPKFVGVWEHAVYIQEVIVPISSFYSLPFWLNVIMQWKINYTYFLTQFITYQQLKNTGMFCTVGYRNA